MEDDEDTETTETSFLKTQLIRDSLHLQVQIYSLKCQKWNETLSKWLLFDHWFLREIPAGPMQGVI